MKKQLQKLVPRATRDDTLIRAGANADGGYLVPSSAKQCKSVVSIGIGGDVSFDYFFAENGAKVYQYDHTVSGVPTHQNHPNFIFHREGWGVAGGRSLQDMLPEDALMPALLKCDIEGAELPNLADLDPNELAKYAFLVFELHDLGRLGDPGFLTLFTRVVSVLTHGHYPVHLHGNNYASVASFGKVRVPWVMEITLQREVPLGIRPVFRDAQDFPNNPHNQDIDMDALIATWLD